MTDNQTTALPTPQSAPPWFSAVAVIALLWNLLGLAALMVDALSAGPPLTAEQAVFAATVPAWTHSASWIGVGAGVAGAILLLRRSNRAVTAFTLSLIAVIVQDVGMFGIADATAAYGQTPLIMQGCVLIIALLLLWLAIRAKAAGWTR